MRFRGECGHCGFVAKSVAAMQKHMASHEDHPIEDDNSMELGTEAAGEISGIKSEPEQGEDEDVDVESPILRPDKDSDSSKVEGVSLEGSLIEDKSDPSVAEDYILDPLNGTFEQQIDHISPGRPESFEGQTRRTKQLKSPEKELIPDIQVKKEKDDGIQGMSTLRSLLTSQITPSPDREGMQQLNSDDFIAFLEKDAGYPSDGIDDCKPIKKETINDVAKQSSNPDEIGSQFTSWSMEETGLKQTLSFYCNVAGCKETFPSLDILQGHLRFEHPRIRDPPNGYRCKVNFCGKQYSSFSDLLNHLSVDHCKLKEEEGDNEILCILSHCRKKFTSMEEAAKHVKEAHNNENLSLIGLKKIKTEYIENVTLDDIPPGPESSSCKAESTPFGYNDSQEYDLGVLGKEKKALGKDIRKLMSGNGYRCELEKCYAHFRTKWEFSNHVRTFHAAIGACVYYCAFCSYAATSMERVKEHTRTACMPEFSSEKYTKHSQFKKSKKKKVPTATLR